jgi:hypothetical protein
MEMSKFTFCVPKQSTQLTACPLALPKKANTHKISQEQLRDPMPIIQVLKKIVPAFKKKLSKEMDKARQYTPGLVFKGG